MSHQGRGNDAIGAIGGSRSASIPGSRAHGIEGSRFTEEYAQHLGNQKPGAAGDPQGIEGTRFTDEYAQHLENQRHPGDPAKQRESVDFSPDLQDELNEKEGPDDFKGPRWDDEDDREMKPEDRDRIKGPEDKQKEQEEKIKALEKKMEDLKGQLHSQLAEGKMDEARSTMGQIDDLGKELAQLMGQGEQGPGGGQAPACSGGGQAPVNFGGGGQAMPQCGGGGAAPMNTGGRGPAGFGGGGQAAVNPGGGGSYPAYNNGNTGRKESSGAAGTAKAANPNVQIPDYGKNASKAEIGTMLEAASEKYGIPSNILKAVAWQESTWNPDAKSFDGQHGKGVMQIDDRFHDFAKTDDVWDPKKNIEYGANYLATLKEQTGSWEAALKRYNGGSSYPGKIMALADSQPWSQYA